MAKKKNKQHHAQASAASREAAADPPPKLKRKDYEREMRRLHGEVRRGWCLACDERLPKCL